jgi:hypothetical protein
VLGKDGEALRSFGAVVPETNRNRPQIDVRRVGYSGSDVIWLAKLDRYEIEQWRLDGAIIRSFRRDADWFRPWDYGKESAKSKGLTGPLTVAIWQDSTGLLWTMVRVPSLSGPTIDYSGRERRPLPPFDIEDASIDTMIEVIDPSTSRVLASQRFPQFMLGHIERDLVYSLGHSEGGDLRVDIWRIKLTPTERR